MAITGGITLELATQNLNDALSALANARKLQAHAVSSASGGRSTQRPLHSSLLVEVQFWRGEVARLERSGMAGGGPRVRSVIPV